MNSQNTNLTKDEIRKIESTGLRGTILDEINSEKERFSVDSDQLLKFHGMYQQKSRDRLTLIEKQQGAPKKPFVLMVRGRIPGGYLTAKQWLAWDYAADQWSFGSLRLTTRQSIQLHGVLKKNIQSTIRHINQALITTTGACGDVVRNVTQPPNPSLQPELNQLNEYAVLLSKHFIVKTNAWHEIFIDGETINHSDENDKIYGKQYLPRKFKVAITATGNNSVDILTNDLGFCATYDNNRNIEGWFVFAGGGMGSNIKDEQTHPSTAHLIGWIPKNEFINVAEAIVTVQRDFGNRLNRSQARLKYTIRDRGLSWFKDEVSNRSNVIFENRKLPEWNTPTWLGWHQARDETWSVGIHTLSGRIVDSENKPLKSALRYAIEKWQLDVQITPDQDLILLGIPKEHKKFIKNWFDQNQIQTEKPNGLLEKALTCVALPMCIKAFAESERIGPNLLTSLQNIISDYHLNNKAPVIRITGCPNGCARPFMAELAFVGQKPGHYMIFVGGDKESTRLNWKLKEMVPYESIPNLIGILFKLWSEQGHEDEHFGDFTNRTGLQYLNQKINDLTIKENAL